LRGCSREATRIAAAVHVTAAVIRKERRIDERNCGQTLGPMKVCGIAGQVPVIIELSGAADVVKAVVDEERASGLRGKDVVDAPAFEHLREAVARRWFVGGGQGETVTDVVRAIASLGGWVIAVLDVEGAIAAGVVDGVCPGVASDKVQAVRSALLQRDLQAVVDRTVAVAQLVNVAQEGKLRVVRAAGLLVTVDIVGVNVLIDVAQAVEAVALVTDVGQGQGAIFPERLLDIQVPVDDVGGDEVLDRAEDRTRIIRGTA
jgi:hypothetical protein